MERIMKTTTDITKAIRFLDNDKAFGVVVYMQAMNIAGQTDHLYTIDVERVFAEDLARDTFYVVATHTSPSGAEHKRYLMHPCADEFAHINLF
jgi:hypothetical protein